MQYTTDPIDLSVEYGVLVWAYSPAGDGLPAKAVWTPIKCKISYIPCSDIFMRVINLCEFVKMGLLMNLCLCVLAFYVLHV